MRRANPENIYLARRAATFNRLVTEALLEELDAEHWIARWEREAERLGLDRLTQQFWQDGRDWIAENRRRR
jgi:predicted alpha/beta hydrolase family esterase